MPAASPARPLAPHLAPPAATPTARPPTLDPVAAARWQAAAPASSPWLHEEVARRMQERLQWLLQPPGNWCHWDAVRGGLQAHALIAARYPKARCQVYDSAAHCAQAAQQALAPHWWQPARWGPANPHFGAPADASVQLLWANMALHLAGDPQALIARWLRALTSGGYLMFSCLGPDTLRELHALYATLGWPPAGQAFTDMHDWGDMLVQAGFGEPVLDMERITLSFATPERLLQELRGLARNLHPQRFAALRGKRWRTRLHQALTTHLPGPQQDGQLPLTFEIIYGHALKPAPQMPLRANSTVPLQDMRAMLRG